MVDLSETVPCGSGTPVSREEEDALMLPGLSDAVDSRIPPDGAWKADRPAVPFPIGEEAGKVPRLELARQQEARDREACAEYLKRADDEEEKERGDVSQSETLTAISNIVGFKLPDETVSGRFRAHLSQEETDALKLPDVSGAADRYRVPRGDAWRSDKPPVEPFPRDGEAALEEASEVAMLQEMTGREAYAEYLKRADDAEEKMTGEFS